MSCLHDGREETLGESAAIVDYTEIARDAPDTEAARLGGERIAALGTATTAP